MRHRETLTLQGEMKTKAFVFSVKLDQRHMRRFRFSAGSLRMRAVRIEAGSAMQALGCESDNDNDLQNVKKKI